MKTIAVHFQVALEQGRHPSSAFIASVGFMARAQMQEIDDARRSRQGMFAVPSVRSRLMQVRNRPSTLPICVRRNAFPRRDLNPFRMVNILQTPRRVPSHCLQMRVFFSRNADIRPRRRDNKLSNSFQIGSGNVAFSVIYIGKAGAIF